MTESNVSNGLGSDTINITLKNPKDSNSSIAHPNMQSTSYIIDLNQQLLNGNRELITENNSLKKDLEKKDEEIADKEDELGREEKSNTYLKNLLKNFLEMDKLYQEISENRRLISESSISYITNYKENIKSIRYTFLSIFGLLLSSGYWFLPPFILCAFIIFASFPIVVIEYYLYIFELPKHKKEEDIIKDVSNEIKELNAAQDYVHEFINNI